MADYSKNPLLNELDRRNKPFTDNTIIQFGVHKGKALKNIPDIYLLSLHQSGKAFGKLAEYIIDNLDSIKQNTK